MKHHIVEQARGWIGTRFHHQGRLKKSATHAGGVDCLGLLVGVAEELQLKTKGGGSFRAFDKTDYSHQPDTHALIATLESLLYPLPVGGISAGDIILLAIDESPQHLAIVSDFGDDLGMIHAYAPARKVVEHALDNEWITKIASAFSIPA